MPLVHPNVEPAGGTLTYTEWNTAHSISAGSFEIGSSTIFFTDIALYRNSANSLQLGAGDSFYIPGNLAVGGTMTSSGGALNNYGSATIAPTYTTFVVTHGYGSTPHLVILTPTTDTGGKRWWVDKTTTQFTINIDSAYSSTIKFDWGTA
jgi:hypothetical protein